MVQRASATCGAGAHILCVWPPTIITSRHFPSANAPSGAWLSDLTRPIPFRIMHGRFVFWNALHVFPDS
eukprot:7559147-Heterocapsa_arctica.AAC.1